MEFHLLPRQLCLELDSHHSSLLVGVSSQVHYESIEEILSVWPDMAHAVVRLKINCLNISNAIKNYRCSTGRAISHVY